MGPWYDPSLANQASQPSGVGKLVPDSLHLLPKKENAGQLLLPKKENAGQLSQDSRNICTRPAFKKKIKFARCSRNQSEIESDDGCRRAIEKCWDPHKCE